MKYNTLFKAAVAFLMAATLCAACNKTDDPKNTPESEIVTTFDDLSFFQNAFVKVKIATETTESYEVGEIISVAYSVGEPIYENDATNLYIGVEGIDEALEYWDACLAPDITRTSSADNKYTYTLTDEEGKSQGTVSFTPGAEGSVAQITTSLPGLECFEKVTFLLNSAWPFNDDVEPINHLGDIRYFSAPTLGSQAFVCIRERSNGVKPYYVAITKDTYLPYKHKIDEKLIETKWCPGEASAKTIYDLLHKDWDFFVAVFDEAGGGKLDLDQGCWIDKNQFQVVLEYQYAFNLTNGEFERLEKVYHEPHRRVLLKVNWIDDDALSFIPGENSGGYTEEEPDNIFDGQKGTKWCAGTGKRTGDSFAFSGKKCWFVEFESLMPIAPVGYDITTADSAKKRSGRNPKEWALLGKKSVYDAEWTVLDKRTDGDLPAQDSKTKNFKFNTTSNGSDWRYFRLEITEKKDASLVCMQFADFKFTY